MFPRERVQQATSFSQNRMLKYLRSVPVLATSPRSGNSTRMYLKKSARRQPNMMRMIQMAWTEYHHLQIIRSLPGSKYKEANEVEEADEFVELEKDAIVEELLVEEKEKEDARR